MTFNLSRASIWSLAALLLACQPQESADDDDSDNGGSGATAATGATAGMPGSGTGGSAGSDAGMYGAAGTPPLGGMGGTPEVSGGAPAASGAGAGAGAPIGGGAGLGAGDGGAPSAGMSGGGAGGALAGTGGDLSAGTGGALGGAGMGGMSGAGGTPGSAHPCPDGCAELSVPFTVWNSGQYFEIYLNSATDLSAAVISVKARKIAGKAGGLLIVVKDGSAQNYAYAQGAWNAINDMTGEFATFTLDVAAPSSTDENNPFTASAVQIITVQLAAGGAWYLDEAETMEDPAALVNPTVVQIDEISITGTGTLPGPWPFTSDASSLKATITEDGLNATPPYAVTGSTVMWVGP